MLNYKELSKKLDSFLESKTKEDLEKWLEMDRERMSFTFKNKVPQVFTNKHCGVITPQINKNLQFQAGFFIFMNVQKQALNANR